MMHGWITTYTGKKFWPLDPQIAGVDIVDIAHALSRICRFGGHTKKFYSVAEHSCYVAEIVKRVCPSGHKSMYAAALLHDASEAYLGDVVTPIKATMPMYKAAEEKLMTVIFQALGVPELVKGGLVEKTIKEADEIMFVTEYSHLFNNKPFVPRTATIFPSPMFAQGLDPVSSEVAEFMFLDRWERWK